MFKYLDLLIGLSAIMLLGSMIVSFIMQWISDLLNRRGRRLLGGLAELLQQCDPQLSPEIAGQVAHAVLTHPRIRGFRGRLGAVIGREELVKILLELASPDSPNLEAGARNALRDVLARSGIKDPARTLESIRSVAVKLEATNPELATYLRNQIAILNEAAGTFVNRVMSFFDGAMDRLSHVFQVEMRLWGILVGVIIAVGLQLDTFRLVNTLAVDDQLRAELVRDAMTRVETERAAGQTPTGAAANGAVPVLKLEDVQNLLGSQLVTPPSAEWFRQWRWDRLPGILITAVLFSLGAPFWFGALKNLLRLRPAPAAKDDEDRSDRRATQAAAPAPAIVATAGNGGDKGEAKGAG
jgi:hypothetical protein